MLADDRQHDLISPGSNGEEAEVPVHATDIHLVGVAHPSPELQATVHQLPAQTPALQLAHGRQLRHIVPFGVQLCKENHDSGVGRISTIATILIR